MRLTILWQKNQNLACALDFDSRGSRIKLSSATSTEQKISSSFFFAHECAAFRYKTNQEIALDNHAARISRMIIDLFDVAIVQLRSHPGLFLGGKPSWPPVWANANRHVASTAWGELGVLLKAYTTDKLSKTCYLVMEHESETYIGALILENATLCQHPCSVFQRNIGRTISEIGSLDFAYTL